jgi:hypothetical protein
LNPVNGPLQIWKAAVRRSEIDRRRIFSPPKVAANMPDPEIYGEFVARSCIAATLAVRTKLNRAFRYGDRL